MKFTVHITTRIDDEIEVEASSKKEAEHLVWEMVEFGDYNALDSYDIDTEIYVVK